jgi:hypothetical protein
MTKVYPAKASALNVHHPIAGKPHVDGTDWPYDVFTMRRLSDGSFTEDSKKAYKPPAAEVEADKTAASESAAVMLPDVPSNDGKSSDDAKGDLGKAKY